MRAVSGFPGWWSFTRGSEGSAKGSISASNYLNSKGLKSFDGKISTKGYLQQSTMLQGLNNFNRCLFSPPSLPRAPENGAPLTSIMRGLGARDDR